MPSRHVREVAVARQRIQGDGLANRRRQLLLGNPAAWPLQIVDAIAVWGLIREGAAGVTGSEAVPPVLRQGVREVHQVCIQRIPVVCLQVMREQDAMSPYQSCTIGARAARDRSFDPRYGQERQEAAEQEAHVVERIA